MEKQTVGIIITAIVFIVYVTFMLYFIKHVRKIHNNKTFVHPKTGKKYYVHGVVKAKHPEIGEWYDAVLYEGIEDKSFYVRKYEDFLLKFQTLSEWEKNEK